MKQKDKRYQKIEERINQTLQAAIRQNPKTICLRPANIIRRAKISPSTFYRHYKTLDSVLKANDRKIFIKFHCHFDSIQKFHPNLQFNIGVFFKFIHENNNYFSIVFTRQNSEVLFKMFKLLEPQIYQECNLPANTPKTFRMLYFEVYSILENWQKNNFSPLELDDVQKDILALFRTIKNRIPPSEQN